ncbi:uncharacterized protein LOC112268853 isoform X1 [Brachypodium distachyon]|uniref:uncharacterized protein LOC112268853 isoform X1 n=1 Tax=Brachypodium distachyon TaxID=15368 RepID=UPI000D0E0114|nr:uncharacterized protein LOC112268853 isoform X1 [Brachypodium distachyon]|eukprot:XP_024310800.1 uncharacterized protein LOC112268853 isoform X1 [Brachypodium distachyon]
MSIMSANAASITRKYCASWLLKAEPRTSILSGFGWLQETIDTPGETYTMLRMSARVFFDLHDLLVERYGLTHSPYVSSYESLAMFLWTLGGFESNRRTQNRFKHSPDTIHRKFHEVLHCVVSMSAHYIKPKDPNFRNVHHRIRNDRRAYSHLKNCIGAIDGTHIRAVILVDQQVRYIGRTDAITQNVMAVCDFDMHFTYASIGQPGAMHDTSVLYHAIDKDRVKFPHPPKGKYYLVDASYPNRLGYLAPYKGERYHVPDFHIEV